MYQITSRPSICAVVSMNWKISQGDTLFLIYTSWKGLIVARDLLQFKFHTEKFSEILVWICLVSSAGTGKIKSNKIVKECFILTGTLSGRAAFIWNIVGTGN